MPAETPELPDGEMVKDNLLCSMKFRLLKQDLNKSAIKLEVRHMYVEYSNSSDGYLAANGSFFTD